MGLFSKKSQSYLGVDFGAASLKIVELANDIGRPKLITYGFCGGTPDITENNWAENKQKLATLLNHLVKQSHVTTRKVVTALPNFSVFSSIISVPPMSKSDFIKAVNWEAKKFVPMPLEEMMLDWKIIKNEDKAENKNNNQKVLVTAAPKDMVNRYVELFKLANLQLLSLETPVFAIRRSLVGNDKSTIMTADIGYTTTDINVIGRGIPVLNRSVNLGGKIVTQELSKRLGIDEDESENYKQDLSSLGDPVAIAMLSDVLKVIIQPLVNEIKYCFTLYANQGDNLGIEKIILTGGSSFLPQLADALSHELGVKIFVGDPWSRVIYPVDLKDHLNVIGPSFSVAIGLAMREIE